MRKTTALIVVFAVAIIGLASYREFGSIIDAGGNSVDAISASIVLAATIGSFAMAVFGLAILGLAMIGARASRP